MARRYAIMHCRTEWCVANQVRIERLSGREAAARGYLPQIDAIFFGAAAKVYEPGPERDAFREKWLGRFLACETDVLLLALAPDGSVAGYLVGTLENAALSARFSDMAHFREQFAEACAAYPAHLHINIAPHHRGRGLGAELVMAFRRIVTEAGLPGLHVTTGKGMRNVAFYLKCGFREIAALQRNGGAMLFLGLEA